MGEPADPPGRVPLLMILISTLSTALEYYDFVIFAFFVKPIGALFFPHEIPQWIAELQTFGIFAAGYMVRPLGGIVFAHYGDIFGRKRTFMLTVQLMVVSSFGIAAMPTYSSIGIAAPVLLLLLRLVQGAAIGGEVPGAWTFVTEHVPPNRMGLACGVLTSGVALGILIGSLTAVAVNAGLTQADVRNYGWRLPFLIGGGAGLVSLFLRRYLAETPIFRALQHRNAVATRLPVGIVLREHRIGVMLSIALGWLLAATNVVLLLMTPTLLQTVYHLPAETALQANTVSTVGLLFGLLAAGPIIDWMGGGRFLIAGSVLLGLVTYLLFSQLAAHPGWLLQLYTLAGLSAGVIVAVPYVMVESFPSAVRFTGVSFSYNLAWAVFGGLTPAVVIFGLRFDPMAHLHYLLIVDAVGLLTGVAVLARQSSRLRPDGGSVW
ncbi:MFS transporter [Bradyrhizobium genosp. P]|uniref:MFS transporter n=1 Tax=Bradyrhizobium genosp. P TaxID=83641 RepID=UPI003CE74207